LSTAEQQAARRPGRPRSARADDAIRGATIQLLVQGGYTNLSIEGVAALAGVGKTTIYRRYPNKYELVAAAFRAMPDFLAPSDTGSLRGDWEELIASDFSGEAVTERIVLLPRLLSDAQTEPELLALIQELFIEPRRTVAKEVLRRGIERGEVDPGTDLDLTVDLLVGAMVYRALVSGGDAKALAPMPERTVEMLLRGIATA
jgi:AcrR family transcriptional regulator